MFRARILKGNQGVCMGVKWVYAWKIFIFPRKFSSIVLFTVRKPVKCCLKYALLFILL